MGRGKHVSWRGYPAEALPRGSLRKTHAEEALALGIRLETLGADLQLVPTVIDRRAQPTLLLGRRILCRCCCRRRRRRGRSRTRDARRLLLGCCHHRRRQGREIDGHLKKRAPLVELERDTFDPWRLLGVAEVELEVRAGGERRRSATIVRSKA